jgi:heptaprenyl diphosphate synthase
MDLINASIVSVVRLLTVFLLFGGLIPFIYSIAGATLSLAVMYLLKKLTPFSEIGVSVAGGVSHNVAQIIVAVFMFNTQSLIYYLPVLIVSGTVSGILIGLISGILIKKIKLTKEK